MRVGVGEARAKVYKDNDLVLLSRCHPRPDEEAEDAAAAVAAAAKAAAEDATASAPAAASAPQPSAHSAAGAAAGGADADAAEEGGDGEAEGLDEGEADGGAAADTHCLALVEQSEGGALLRLRLHLPATGCGAADESRFRLVRSALSSAPSAPPWYLLRLCNLSTIQREWLALHAARSLPFADAILSASPRPGAGASAWRCPPPLGAELARRFNPSQLAAIQAGALRCASWERKRCPL